MFHVGVYEVNRVYGGPEEGGWWFDTGELIISETYRNEDSARSRFEDLREQYPHTGKRYSVLGGADWDVEFSKTELPNYFPEEYPSYE